VVGEPTLLIFAFVEDLAGHYSNDLIPLFFLFYCAIIINKYKNQIDIIFYKRIKVIGREKEIDILEEALTSNRAEMIAVYGRRRIGKTYLIEQFYKKSNIKTISLIGQSGATMQTQLDNAKHRLFEQHGIDVSKAKNWTDIFNAIKIYHQERPKKHFVLFIDELPWIATPKSGFIGALSYGWNSYFEEHTNVTFVLCGSAASWMIKKIVNEKGGLHQRLTRQIPLYPFSLKESEAYLKQQGFHYLSRKEIVDIYIVLGGVAQYLSFLNPQKSISENINQLCFSIGGELTREFQTLFVALFGKKGIHQQIVKYLGSVKKRLFLVDEISKKFDIKIEQLYITLDELEMAGFITKYTMYGRKKRDARYSLTDPFSAFYLKWISKTTQQDLLENENYWQFIVGSQNWISWAGNSFESVCHKHILPIKKALGISGVHTQTYYWQEIGTENTKGTQIDMLIQRADKTVMVIEIKYYNQPFSISKSYATNLKHKIESFREKDKKNNSLMLVMLTTYGVKKNSYSNMINKEIIMDSLFED
jgi:AAA+ ATPase superfamily predicted ATPase